MVDKPTYEVLEQRLRELERAESKRQRDEKTLREQLLRQRTLMDVSPDGIAIIDQEHKVRQANASFAEMLGYTMEEVLELHTWDWEAIMSEAEIRANFADLTKTRMTFETSHRRKDGTIYDAEVTASGAKLGDEPMVLTITRNITDRKQAYQERERLIEELQDAMERVKTLNGLIPICASCKKIRDDKGYWQQVEVYVRDHSEAKFSHGICPECTKKLYPEYVKDE
jgi:PAS domain S-box-containing protein